MKNSIVIVAVLGIVFGVKAQEVKLVTGNATDFYYNNGKVGIGTTSPNQKLHIYDGNLSITNSQGSYDQYFGEIKFYNRWATNSITAASIGVKTKNGANPFNYSSIVFNTWNGYNTLSEKMRISYNGHVGIGTANPTSKLDVNGSANFSGRVSLLTGTIVGPKENLDGKLWIDRHATQGKTFFAPYDDGAWQWGREFGYNTAYNSWYVSSNFGIGTTDTKGFKLGVKGKIAAEEVKVASHNNWPDFVFDKEYALPTLKEVESHIKEKGHLKDIPSAKEVAENGIFLGEMNAKLLQKIEELTLYTIAQEKKIKTFENQNNEIKMLKKENKALDYRLSKIEALLVKNNK